MNSLKNYRESGQPNLAQIGRFIYTGKSKAIRKPAKTWKTVLKEQRKIRAVKVQERERPLPAEMVEWLQKLTG